MKNAKVAAKFLSITKQFDNLSFAELKELRKQLNTTIQGHKEYVKAEPKVHIAKRKEAAKAILDKVLGFNAALREAKKLIKDGTIIVRELNTPSDEYQQGQVNFA